MSRTPTARLRVAFVVVLLASVVAVGGGRDAEAVPAPALGTLTHTGCVSNAALAGCTTAPAASIGGASSVAVSPDGTHAYTAAWGASDAVTSFDVAANGTLTHTGCVSNTAITGCDTAPAASLEDASSVAVSPDGTRVYTAAESSDAVSSFDVATNGTLTHTGCVSNAALAGCTTAPAASLDWVVSVAVSPDGTHVYTTANSGEIGQGGAVSSFDVAANGTLAHTGCVSNATLAGCATAAAATPSLRNPQSVAVSPNGTHVYAAAPSGVTSFDVTPDTYRPDNHIRRGSGPWVGNDRYNKTGFRQTRTAKVRRGGKVTYYVRVQNDGNVTDRFKVRGGRHDRKWAVNYFYKGKNISKGVKAGSYQFKNLAPKESRTVKVVVKPKTPARKGNKKGFLVTSTSVAKPTAKDAVKTVTKRR